jgi:hypothetical protein
MNLPLLSLRVGLSLMPAAASAQGARIEVDALRPVGVVGNLYSVGYDGWGDITNRGMVGAFQDLGVQYCRMEANLRELCGERPGDYHWDYLTPRDIGIGFVDRVRRLRAEGWTPLLAFSYHGAGGALPQWFHGEPNDANQKAWVRYNVDGSLGPDGLGDQLAAATDIAADVAAHLASAGLTGLHWETMYEMGHDMPLAEIHHAVARGVRQGDATATLIGPATWPGWTVEERFVKPYLAKYGPDLLDKVSVHWYASNDHGLWKLWEQEPQGFILTMAHEPYLAYMLEHTGDFGDWTRSLRALLDDPQLNPGRKPVGIIFTEIDVNATSYYLRNPENPDWPTYRADTDCWLNTNYFGGVWWASVLCHIASVGVAAEAAKFNTRNYYGLAEMAPEDRAYRYPVWFALRLLQEHGGLVPGRRMIASSTTGARELEAFATGGPEDLRLILINKAFISQAVEPAVSGLAAGDWRVMRYLFDQTRVAAFRGRKPGEHADGTFEGAPDNDSPSRECLEPVETLRCTTAGPRLVVPPLELPALSLTVLRLERP